MMDGAFQELLLQNKKQDKKHQKQQKIFLPPIHLQKNLNFIHVHRPPCESNKN
jgi:hypothetical protein